eukprot:CAMPEP_0177533222 /NCGR_PEP_ID=MMETSP0369-20130122/55169_1 /TAXON_ID=447022 ORGANISM="Scrippsiella hangoei-like, Strain SHHI-4" /NCGR_SAMPLE_ID=MMETSP0369 /ASSEMBLY_ACC=CAM_ASM_000364 /LENGTH=36 /DNA_ID= /DNA_START= /DNA_END= /DNA_ORIENTATION=
MVLVVRDLAAAFLRAVAVVPPQMLFLRVSSGRRVVP